MTCTQCIKKAEHTIQAAKLIAATVPRALSQASYHHLDRSPEGAIFSKTRQLLRHNALTL